MRTLIFILLALNVSAQSSGDRPNIVFILADDLGQNEISRNGDLYDTPNIDFLCNNGAYYERFYVQRACSQTRAAFMTGRHPWKIGMSRIVRVETHDRTMPSDTLTVSQELRELGYITGIVGKWHLGDEPWSRSRYYDFNYSYEQLISAPHYYNHWVFGADDLNENGVCKGGEEQGNYGTHLLRDRAVEFIESASKTENPFFLYVPFTAPHSPWQCTYGNTNDELKECMMSEFDDAVGDIYQAIVNAGIEENTLIVFGSDNGGVRNVPSDDSSNEPYRGFKNGWYEGAFNVPFTFYWKNTIAPQVIPIDKPVHIIDLLPTFVDLAGGNTKAYWDGISMLPFGTVAPDRLLTVRTHQDLNNGNWSHTIAYNEFVYVQPPTLTTQQIYNLSNDISQTNDLYGSTGLETMFDNEAANVQSLFYEQPHLLDNVNWMPPRCYGHEHRRDDFYKDEYIPLEFIAN